MVEEKPLRFVVMVGSLRKGSFNAAIARALPLLAPEGVSIAPLGSVGDFPLYNHDLQVQGFPPAVARNGGRDSPPLTASSSSRRSITTRFPAASKTRSTGSPVCPISLSPPSRSRLRALRRASGAVCAPNSPLRQMFVYLDGRLLLKPEVIIPQVQTKVDPSTGELTDPATRGFIADQLKAFAAFVRR